MSKFRKNTPINTPDKDSERYINKAEDGVVSKEIIADKFQRKEFTFPLSSKHAGLLEKIYNYHDGDISRRKIGSKALAFGIEKESEKLGITISEDEYE
jgi:hypothetical protein